MRWRAQVCTCPEDLPTPTTGSQGSKNHPSITMGNKVTVTEVGLNLDPHLSGDPVAKTVKTDTIKR